MFPFFGRKKSDDSNQPVNDDKKRPLEQLEADLTVLDKNEMTKLEGGKTGSRTFSDVLGWSSSLGDTIPQ